MRSLRVVLYGDGPWAADTLRALAAGAHRVVAVVARERPSDDSLLDAARRLEIPVLQPERVNADDTVRRIAALAPDLGLSIAYNQILRPAILDVHALGVVNIHAGKLPFYRGRNIINWAIINGERELGITAHYVDEGIDTGDIIAQITIPIAWTDGYGDVLWRVVERIPGLAGDTLDAIAAGTASRRAQSPPRGTYFGGRRDGDEWLDWTATSRDLHNKIRAITRPGPGARTVLGNVPVTIWRAYYDPEWPRWIAIPGQVVERHGDEGVMVKTGDSMLLLQEVEVEGEQPAVPVWSIGTRLGVDMVAMMHALITSGSGYAGGAV